MLKNYRSDLVHAITGVPQSSFLELTLFLLYINDVSTIFKNPADNANSMPMILSYTHATLSAVSLYTIFLKLSSVCQSGVKHGNYILLPISVL
jgi:hypothetical protein